MKRFWPLRITAGPLVLAMETGMTVVGCDSLDKDATVGAASHHPAPASLA